MQIFLSQQCESLTGTLGRGYGYAVQRRGKNFYGVRLSKGYVPYDGHWRFILACAELAKNRLYITDIKVNWLELQTALYEAKCFTASEMVRMYYADKGKTTYNAQDVIDLQTTFGL